MIFDSKLTFFAGEKAAASMTSKVIDFEQTDPRFGLVGRQFWIVVRMSQDFAATDITVTVEDSEDGKAFSSLDVIVTKGGIQQLVIPMMAYHKRHLRLKLALTGTPAGKVSAVLTDNFTDIDQVELPIE